MFDYDESANLPDARHGSARLNPPRRASRRTRNYGNL